MRIKPLVDAVRLGVPLVDLTRWTARVRDAAWRIATERLSAPVVFSSAWMGGVVPLVVAAVMRDLAAIEVTGRDAEGRPISRRAAISDPAGQSHLTAIGGVIQLERILGLASYPAPEPLVMFPESTPQLDASLQTLRELGVSVTVETVASGTPRSR